MDFPLLSDPRLVLKDVRHQMISTDQWIYNIFLKAWLKKNPETVTFRVYNAHAHSWGVSYTVYLNVYLPTNEALSGTEPPENNFGLVFVCTQNIKNANCLNRGSTGKKVHVCVLLAESVTTGVQTVLKHGPELVRKIKVDRLPPP